ncbi:hypothetical protein Hanom_Chr00s216236g01842111 [Helianthus anomalus]
MILGECYMLPEEDQATSKNRTHLSMKLPYSILFCVSPEKPRTSLDGSIEHGK